MSINWKKFSLGFSGFIAVLYILFLILPFIISPFLNSYTNEIEEIVKTSTGFDAKLEKISIVTGFDLSAGVKVKYLSLAIPEAKEPFLKAENASVSLALVPLLTRKIQISSLNIDSASADLVIKKDGMLLIQDYIPESKNDTQSEFALPFGFKLSNRLPNILVKDYSLFFLDSRSGRTYGLEGENFRVKDFILDKKFKLSTTGRVVMNKTVVSNYDIKLFNKIMPNLVLDDLVFPKTVQVEPDVELSKPSQSPTINFMDILKSVYDNKLSADLTMDIKTTGDFKNPKFKGFLDIDALTVGVDGKKLPESYLNLAFKGNKTEIDSIFYTSDDKNEKTQIIGSVKNGKYPNIDLTFRSNAKFNNIINLVDSVATSFNIKDFNTLSATGGIDADFNINSDMKKVSSTGYLNIVPSSITYGLYNIVISNINADVDMMNNNINIKHAGFAIAGHPLNLTGLIKNDSYTNLKLTADKLSVKGLIMAAGQISLLKENEINSGDFSLNAVFKGKLKEIKPQISAIIQNLNVYNKPAAAKIALDNALIKILCNSKSATGDISIRSFVLTHPAAVVKVPDTNILIDEKNINIKKAYLLLNNSRIDVTGSVKDYINDKMSISLNAKGDLQTPDIVSLLPKEFSSLISYKGALPLNVSVNGNSKVQNVKVNLNANPNNYIALADLNVLKGKNTKIHSSIEIIGDSLRLSNTGISNDKSTIATLSGNVSKLYSAPKLNLNVSVPNLVSFPIWGTPNSNISANGNVSVTGDISNPQMRGTINLTDISMKDIDFVISDLVADLSGSILNGNATARQFKVGGIVANDITGKFSLKDYSEFYLTDLSGNAFDGKVKGKLSYIIPSSKIGMEFVGTNLNSTKAVAGAAGINNALTGLLNFNAKLGMQGLTDKEIIKSLKGNVDFAIYDGKFISIGRLENLVAAQNVSSNSILKSAISALSSVAVVQEADKFKSIHGSLDFSNGSANISNILVFGPLMSYYVRGNYNILPNSANLVILGRLDSKVIALLGPLGQLSADKLLSYIPKFGAATSNILKQLTSDPASEDVSLIPQLSSGSTSYKDFKVVFNGPVESSSSVKSFKWLSTCDISEMNIKQDLQNAKDAIKTNINDRVEQAKTNAQNVKNNVNKIIETQKNKAQSVKDDINQTKIDIQTAKENRQQSAENLKNLFKNAVKNSQNKVSEPPAPVVSE